MLLVIKIGLLVFHLLSWCATCHVLLTKSDPRSALGWTAVVLLVPVLGLLLYIVFGISRTQSRAAKIMRSNARLLPSYAYTDYSLDNAENVPLWMRQMEQIGRKLTHSPLKTGNEVHPHFNGNMAYPAMLNAIGKAQRHVLLTTYILNQGEVSKQFVKALIKAHERGCEVRVLLDGIGRFYSLHSPIDALRAAGLPVALFLPPRLFPPNLMINLRNHRKIMVCDDVAFTGGMNIADYHVTGSGSKHVVQDVHFEITGPVVASYYRAFYMDWGFATGSYVRELPPCNFASTGTAYCRAALDGPGTSDDSINALIAGCISTAMKHVWIMTPYFLPTREITTALRTAALKGVDVRVILPSVNNLIYVHWASRRVLPALLETGVRIYYQPPPFAHTKLLCVDNYYAQIGSVNYDSRSLRLNFELNTEIFDKKFNARMRLFMVDVLKKSHELKREEVEKTPVPARLRDAFFWLFSPYL